MNQDILNAKKEVVSKISTQLKEHNAVVICENLGLTVDQMMTLRKSLREKGASMYVYKNSLVSKALSEEENKELGEVLTGPNAYVFVKDATDGSLKILTKFAKKNEVLKIKGGIIDGKVMTTDEIVTLAKLPSRETLISMLAGALLGNISKLAVALDQVRVQKENA